MNLHAIVRGAITTVHPDEVCVLIQSAGVTNVDGILENKYRPGVTVAANWQPTGEPLQHEDGMSTTTQESKVYLYSNQPYPVKGVSRLPMLRTGDFLARKDGTYWLVTDVTEDWSEDGWALVTVTLQTEAPHV